MGRGHDRRPEVLRRESRADRPRAGGVAAALRHRVRDRAQVAGRGRGAAPEMDRPVAVAQYLYGGGLGQEARRHVQARLDPGAEDHLLPAGDGSHPSQKVDHQGRPAQCRSDSRRAEGVLHRKPGLRGMPVITLGARQFAGPFISRLWTPPRAPGLYAVMVPGWRLLMFHAVHFGHAADLSAPGLVKEHPKYEYWMTLAGSEWNLYIATSEMYDSTEGERRVSYEELLALPATATRGQAHAQL